MIPADVGVPDDLRSYLTGPADAVGVLAAAPAGLGVDLACMAVEFTGT